MAVNTGLARLRRLRYGFNDSLDCTLVLVLKSCDDILPSTTTLSPATHPPPTLYQTRPQSEFRGTLPIFKFIFKNCLKHANRGYSSSSRAGSHSFARSFSQTICNGLAWQGYSSSYIAVVFMGEQLACKLAGLPMPDDCALTVCKARHRLY